MHAIAGLPRSGSTLLCNILNQNPKFYASDTSTLVSLVESCVSVWSVTPEVKGELGSNRNAVEQRLRRVLRSICKAWYDDDRTIFDKSRRWTGNVRLLQYLYPTSKVIVLVRDLREVFASFEKQDRKNPALRLGERLTIEQRIQRTFNAKGMIGGPLNSIKSIIDSKAPAFFVRYEDLAVNPQVVMQELYEHLDETKFEHNFDNVKNVSNEPDHLWLHKYPHQGSGQVKLPPPQWNKYISESIGNAIVNHCAWFYNIFYPEVLSTNVDPT